MPQAFRALRLPFRSWCVVAMVAAGVVQAPASGWAQGGTATASISGRALDETGAALPGSPQNLPVAENQQTTHFFETPVGQRLADHLRPNACRVTHSDSDNRFACH